MSVASLFTPCFVMFCVFLYGPFCHGAHKLDLSTLFTTSFLCLSPPFIFYLNILQIKLIQFLFCVVISSPELGEISWPQVVVKTRILQHPESNRVRSMHLLTPGGEVVSPLVLFGTFQIHVNLYESDKK